MNNRDFFAHTLGDEHPRSMGVLSAVPADADLEYRPHEVSRSARELIGHILGHYEDLVEAIEDGVVHHRMQVDFDGVDDAVAKFDAAFNSLSEKLEDVDDATWEAPVKMYVGDHMAWEAPVMHMMWGFIFDVIHHRGQLSTYLRPMGGKVPAIYGPSADTMQEGG